MADETEVPEQPVEETPEPSTAEPVENKNSPQEHNITGQLDHSTYPPTVKGK